MVERTDTDLAFDPEYLNEYLAIKYERGRDRRIKAVLLDHGGIPDEVMA